MTNFKVVPIPDHIALEARREMISPQYRSLAAASSLANGYGPCRSCLRVFRQGAENRIYITYNSSEGLSQLPSPGPIFIHEENCEPYDADGFPPELRGLPMLFEAFGPGDHMMKRNKAESALIEQQIDDMFSCKEIEHLKVRNAEAGCFIALIIRA